MSDPRESDVALTPVQMAVFAACVAHTRSSFAPIEPTIWWRAPEPFKAGAASFAAHLRELADARLLARRVGTAARYDLTLAGENLARLVGTPDA